MSLDNTANNTEEKQEGKKQKEKKTIEEQAKEFSNLFWEGKKKQALEFYQKLNSDVQRYIQTHKSYSLDLKGARLGGI